MKRSNVLNHIRVAGYHDDEDTALRLYLEYRVSYQSYQEAHQQGRRMRDQGVPCTCSRCARERVVCS